MNINPYGIKWCYFDKYYKYCDQYAFKGACYAFVFSETMPKDYEYPHEFEECVYIGQSSGYYKDKQAGHKGKMRSLIHKRMTSHHKPLMHNEGCQTHHKMIVQKYGYGRDVLMGTITNKPLWLGLIIPPPSINDNHIRAWTMYQEAKEILDYTMTWNKTPLGNMDRDTNKDPNSYSSIEMANMVTLEEFIEAA